MAKRMGKVANSSSRLCFTFVRVTTPTTPSTALPTKFAVAEKHTGGRLRSQDYTDGCATGPTCKTKRPLKPKRGLNRPPVGRGFDLIEGQWRGGVWAACFWLISRGTGSERLCLSRKNT